MSDVLERQSVFAAKKESLYGVDPGSWAAADAIAVLEGIEIPSYTPDAQERNVIQNSFFSQPSVRGAETDVTGSASIELHGKETAPGAVPESSILWESAIGVVSTLTGASAVVAAPAPTTTVFTLTTGDVVAEGFAVDDAIVVQSTTGWSITWITAIATDALTVSPALPVAPATATVVTKAATLYTPVLGDQASFYSKFWQGDQFRYDVPGCMVSQLTMDFATGEIVKPQFSYSAKQTVEGVSETSTVGLGAAAAYDSSNNPLVAVNMEFEIGGSTYAVSNVSISIENEQYKTQSITTSGITNISKTGTKISGSFTLEFENMDIESAFRADTPAVLKLAALKSSAGSAFAIRMPAIRYTAVPKSVDSGIYKHDITFDMQSQATDAGSFFLLFL